MLVIRTLSRRALCTLSACLLCVPALSFAADSPAPANVEARPPLSQREWAELRALPLPADGRLNVTLRAHVIAGDVTRVEVVKGCGSPDVDRAIASWIWRTYHYARDFSGVAEVTVWANSPLQRTPAVRLSHGAWNEVHRADPHDQKEFWSTVRFELRNGKVRRVSTLKSCGLPLVDAEVRAWVRKRWTCVADANGNYLIPVRIHYRYYP